MAAKVRLGHTYRDKFVGIVGIAAAIEYHITGCNRVRMIADDKEGEKHEYTFDQFRLELMADVPASMEHPGCRPTTELGRWYEDRLSGEVGRAVVVIERAGNSDAFVQLEKLDKKGCVITFLIEEKRLAPCDPPADFEGGDCEVPEQDTPEPEEGEDIPLDKPEARGPIGSGVDVMSAVGSNNTAMEF